MANRRGQYLLHPSRIDTRSQTVGDLEKMGMNHHLKKEPVGTHPHHLQMTSPEHRSRARIRRTELSE
jgi:hypothetical protein